MIPLISAANLDSYMADLHLNAAYQDALLLDDSASERALRNFTIGRKNWVTINTILGAQASAVIYSVTEAARANGLNVYCYIRHLLTELKKLKDTDGNIDQTKPEPLMPRSKGLPTECYMQCYLVHRIESSMKIKHIDSALFL